MAGTSCALLLGGCLETGTIGNFQTIGAATSGASATTGSTTGGQTTGTGSGTSGGGLGAGSPCDSNTACASQVCGRTGTGHCCVTLCEAGTPACSATDCDATGACSFPDSAITCAAAGCSGNNFVGAGTCNGAGHCSPGPTVDCAPFACTATGCALGCGSDGGCVSEEFCDLRNHSCCDEMTSQVYVDSVRGADATACCGATPQTACQTLGQALALIDSAGAVRETIQATVDGGGGDWAPPGEGYPITLGWNVEVSAPGVYFLDPSAGDQAIFTVAPLSASDLTNWAAITGSSTAHVGIGMNHAQSAQTLATTAIEVTTGETLYIANATVDGFLDNQGHASTAIDVAPGGTLTLGRNAQATVRGGVDIGVPTLWGGTGIACRSDGSRGCVVGDSPLSGQSSVVIQNQVTALSIEDFSIVSLSATPVIGPAPAQTGFLQCPASARFSPANGIVVTGDSATVSFNNGTIQCIPGDGVLVETSAPGSSLSAVTIGNTLIQNTVTAIQQINGGAITVSGSMLRYNGIGVIGVADGIDLSGGGLGLRNSIVCNSAVELQPDERSIGLWNTGSGTIDARNVDWDTSGPDLFLCTPSACTCQLTSCSKPYGSDGMDIVEAEAGTVRTNGNGVVTTSCEVPVAPDGGGL